MIKFTQIAATLFALSGAAVFAIPNFAHAQNCTGNCQQNGSGGLVRGAPAPIAGAGLSILVVGYGVYWLIRRRRKAE
jgi:hypothetical protein